MSQQRHWQQIYQARAPSEASWYQPEARLSLDLIRRVCPDPCSPIIDVGAGASPLADGLLAAGYEDITVLDIAPAGLALARQRLGAQADRVTWIEGDLLTVNLPAGAYALWHDRAVFHFLTEPSDRARYVEQTRRAVRPGGHVIVASFGADGPTRCSGLDVVRYSPGAMHSEFGEGFRLLDSEREDHRTPSGAIQAFIYCLCRVDG